MIAHLTGNLLEKTAQSVIIEVHGVGYEAFIPLSTFYALPEKGQEVHLHTFTYVREDSLTLFGFHTVLEKELFVMLVSVSGVGPKQALAVLSGMGPEELVETMVSGDKLRLCSIPGVGKKTAERITLELQEKASRDFGSRYSANRESSKTGAQEFADDALSALVNLGYSPSSAKQVLKRVQEESNPQGLETLIKEALQLLM